MKVKYIVMKMVDDRAVILRDIASMGAKKYNFLEQIFANVEGDFFLAGEKRVKIMDILRIGYSTYWTRIHDMEEMGTIKKVSRGIYKLNINWVKVFSIEPKIKH